MRACVRARATDLAKIYSHFQPSCDERKLSDDNIQMTVIAADMHTP